MSQLPDAPWIQEAEMEGLPASDPVICPECGQECETIYIDRLGKHDTVFGCDKCLRGIDAWDWKSMQPDEDGGEDW